VSEKHYKKKYLLRKLLDKEADDTIRDTLTTNQTSEYKQMSEVQQLAEEICKQPH
jgi:hypothetical protein